MTGRRAVRQWDERLSRALQFVPGHVGGRVASAQPIRRRGGTLRQASVGGMVVPPTGDVYTAFTGGGTLNFGQVSYPSITLEGFGWDGDTYISLLTCVNVAPLHPSGWTTLLSGSTGSLFYEVAYVQWTGAAATQQATITGGGSSLDPPTNTGRMVWNMWSVTGHLTPAAAVSVRAAATSHPFKAPSAAWGSPWNHNAYVVPHPIGSSSASPTSDGGFTPYLVDYGEGDGYPHLADDMSANGGYGGSQVMSVIDSTRTSTNAWDSASFAFGLTT